MLNSDTRYSQDILKVLNFPPIKKSTKNGHHHIFSEQFLKSLKGNYIGKSKFYGNQFINL